jgi:uncharacterized protein (TIGR02588 family)
MQKPHGQRQESEAKRRLETIAAVFGAVVALGTLGLIVWDGWTAGDAPPFVTVDSLRVHEQEGGFVLEILASNRGGEAAAQVLVEGELHDAGRVVETSETTFDYVPRQSERRGGLFFREDPRTHEVRLRALGYVDP